MWLLRHSRSVARASARIGRAVAHNKFFLKHNLSLIHFPATSLLLFTTLNSRGHGPGNTSGTTRSMRGCTVSHFTCFRHMDMMPTRREHHSIFRALFTLPTSLRHLVAPDVACPARHDGRRD